MACGCWCHDTSRVTITNPSFVRINLCLEGKLVFKCIVENEVRKKVCEGFACTG